MSTTDLADPAHPDHVDLQAVVAQAAVPVTLDPDDAARIVELVRSARFPDALTGIAEILLPGCEHAAADERTATNRRARAVHAAVRAAVRALDKPDPADDSIPGGDLDGAAWALYLADCRTVGATPLASWEDMAPGARDRSYAVARAVLAAYHLPATP